MGKLNMIERHDELRRKEEAHEAIVAKFGSIENALKARNEEDILKFYYCESEDKFLVGQRVDTRYYAEVCKTGLNFIWSRYLPWGEHFVAPNTVWKEHTYPSEPKEIDFFDWLQGYIKQIDKSGTKDIKTNGDKIRNMSDEELAEWMHNITQFYKDDDVGQLEPMVSIYDLDNELDIIVCDSYGDLLEWLQKEVE